MTTILHDIFPASIAQVHAPLTEPLQPPQCKAPDTSPKRVFILDSPPEFRIYTDTAQGPQLAYQTLYDPTTLVSARNGVAFRPQNAPDPTTALIISRSTGCGCGSRLRNFHLPTNTYQATTTKKVASRAV